MNWKRYLGLGVAAFVVAALLNAPAATLYAWLTRSSPPPVQLVGLAGAAHQGTASAVVISGQPLLTNVRWTLHPLWLLAARMSFDVDGDAPEGTFSGRFAYAPGGRVTLSDLALTTALKPLLTALGYPLPWVAGEATIKLDALRLRHGVPKDATGKALLHNLTWAMGQPLMLGDFSAEAARDGDNLALKLASVSGPLELEGSGLLQDDGSYELKLRFKGKADAPAALQNLLQQAGPADLQGYRHIERRGTLAPRPPTPSAIDSSEAPDEEAP